MNPLHDWAVRHCANPALALYELGLVLGQDYPEPLEASDAQSEAGVLSRTKLALSKQGGRAWRNNVGGVDPADPPTTYLRYGLANESPEQNKVLKSSDLIGIRPRIIAPTDVGKLIGQFWARECKHPGWRYTGTDREKAQLSFINLVNRLGGDAAFTNGST